MAIKISSLTESKATVANDVIVLDDGTTTKKMNAKTFQKEVSDPLNTAINDVSEKLATLTDGQSIADGTSIDDIKDNGFYHQIGDWSGTLPTTYSGEWHYSNLLAFNAGVDVTVQMLFHFNRSVFALRTGKGSTTFTWQDWVVYNNPNDIASALSTIDTSLGKKVNISDIIDNLTSTNTEKPLSANQGKVLKSYLDNGNLVINTNTDMQFYKTAGDRKRLMLRPTGPKDITSYYTDGTLWTRITNGFDDIYVGDYFDMGTPVSAYEQTQTYQATGSQWITIADFNLPYQKGDSEKANVNTICCIPGKGLSGSYHFGRSRMNSTNTTIGGYTASEMYTTTIGAVATAASTPAATDSINQQLFNIFGSHLATTRELLCNANTSGTPSGWAWFDTQAVLMSEEEVYGTKVWGNSGFNVGIAWQQLALFQLYPRMVNNRSSYYWLKNITSSTDFAYVAYRGLAAYNSASGAYYYVRPRFILRP